MRSYAIHHINGKLRDNDVSNLAVVNISENLGRNTMKLSKEELKELSELLDIEISVGYDGLTEEQRKRSDALLTRRYL